MANNDDEALLPTVRRVFPLSPLYHDTHQSGCFPSKQHLRTDARLNNRQSAVGPSALKSVIPR
jgi:hypothetical protein